MQFRKRPPSTERLSSRIAAGTKVNRAQVPSFLPCLSRHPTNEIHLAIQIIVHRPRGDGQLRGQRYGSARRREHPHMGLLPRCRMLRSERLFGGTHFGRPFWLGEFDPNTVTRTPQGSKPRQFASRPQNHLTLPTNPQTRAPS